MTGLEQRDELHRPLGAPAPKPKRRASYGKLALLAGALLAIGGGVFLLETDDRLGGEPYAVASVDLHPAAAPGGAVPAAPAGVPLAGEAETSSGVRVVRGGGGAAPGSLVLSVPEAIGLHMLPAPDPRLVEHAKYGPLPRIGADGARPLNVYARPSMVAARLGAGAPRIALVVGGLGLSASGTREAIAQLPGAVSLGFAPYGADLEREAALAREGGHETLLQLPMEPFDYPADNPGPHTLLSGQPATANLDDLHWLMTRFVGYAGVMNFLGAKFTADAAAFSPVLSEIATRGLFYLDDGSSPRSLARARAQALSLPIAVADVVIDANPSPPAIEAALVRLEALARANGAAIGVAAALPDSIAHVGRWARSLEAHGVALVPLSALAARGPGAAAQANP